MWELCVCSVAMFIRCVVYCPASLLHDRTLLPVLDERFSLPMSLTDNDGRQTVRVPDIDPLVVIGTAKSREGINPQ